jgi:hypothetical protein
VPIVLKFGSLNLLEPSGPVKACNGIALPLPTDFAALNKYECSSTKMKKEASLPAFHLFPIIYPESQPEEPKFEPVLARDIWSTKIEC